VLGFSAKICPRAFSLTVTLDPRVIFVILNLHDSSLIESDCNTRPKSLGVGLIARLYHKSVIIK